MKGRWKGPIIFYDQYLSNKNPNLLKNCINYSYKYVTIITSESKSRVTDETGGKFNLCDETICRREYKLSIIVAIDWR